MNTYASCDLETNNKLDPRHGPIHEIGWGIKPGYAVREYYDPNRRDFYQAVFDKYPTQIFHNMLFDVDWLEYHGYTIHDPQDTMGLAHLLNPDLPLGLEFQNSIYSHYTPWKSARRKDPHNYHGTDLDVTIQLWERMTREAKLQGVWDLYLNEWIPATKACLKMKQGGIKVNQRQMHIVNYALRLQVEKIDGALNKVAPIDWNSPKQLASFLYDTLKLPRKVHYKTHNVTTDATALEELLEETNHPVLKLIMMRRQVEKMRSTYTEYDLDEKGYFHGDVSFTASTGRARGFLMTLQKGKMRSLFVPDEEGWEMAYADWNNVEMHVAAVLSGDKHMQEVLNKHNFHNFCASNFFHIEDAKINRPEKYHESKVINHGQAFGRSAKSISDMHELQMSEVNKYLKWMFNEFPKWQSWREAQFKCAVNDGRLTNPFGFTRYFWSGNIKGMAYSFGPQSCPAHMIKRRIVQLQNELPKPARLLLPIHDAALVCYPLEIKKQVHECLNDIMQQAVPELGNWKPKCSISTGKNFQEASED